MLARAFLGLSGADLGSVAREAKVCALLDGSAEVAQKHVDSAVAQVKPSVSREQRLEFEAMARELHTRNVG